MTLISRSFLSHVSHISLAGLGRVRRGGPQRDLRVPPRDLLLELDEAPRRPGLREVLRGKQPSPHHPHLIILTPSSPYPHLILASSSPHHRPHPHLFLTSSSPHLLTVEARERSPLRVADDTHQAGMVKNCSFLLDLSLFFCPLMRHFYEFLLISARFCSLVAHFCSFLLV